MPAPDLPLVFTNNEFGATEQCSGGAQENAFVLGLLQAISCPGTLDL